MEVFDLSKKRFCLQIELNCVTMKNIMKDHCNNFLSFDQVYRNINLQPEGFGISVSIGKTLYEGSWSRGMKNGKGRITSVDPSTPTYFEGTL